MADLNPFPESLGQSSGRPVSAFRIADRDPKWALAPVDRTMTARVLQAAAAQGLVCVPWGGGVRQEMGYPPSRYDAAISTENLTRLVDWQAGDLTVTVEGGMTLEALQEMLSTRRQFVALESPDPARETIGGLLATGASSLLRYAYGPPRDQLIGVAVALPDGSVVHGGGRVVKNVAGYDLCKLFTGSNGTLGIIVEATLRVRPLPQTTRTWVGTFPTAAVAEAALAAVMDSPLQPSFLQAMDPAAARRQTQHEGWTLALGADGNEELSAWTARETARITGVEGSELQGEASESFRERLVKASLPVGSLAARVSVLSSEALALMDRCREKCSDGLKVESTAAAGNGVVFLGFELSEDTAPQAGRNQLKELATWLSHEAAELEGHCVILRAPADLRDDLPLWGQHPAAPTLQQGIRRRLDPSLTLNRGRVFQGERPDMNPAPAGAPRYNGTTNAIR